MTYVITVLNLIILGAVAYLFFNFRKAVDTSGVRQVDDYLHELEGSVAQLTEQFERTSTKISKDLLGKATELQALIGECDAKLAEMARVRAMAVAPPAPVPAQQAVPAEPPQTAPAATPQPRADAVAGISTVPPAVAARRMSAAELLATRTPARPRQPQRPPSPNGAAPTESSAAARAEPQEQAQQVAVQPAVQPPAAEQAPRPAMPSAAGPQEKYRLIFLLASEGMDTASIAKHTNLTRGEVEMLLDLRRQGKI
jgi:hypothetical protein